MRAALIAFFALIASFICEASDHPFTVVRVDTASENIQVFWGDEHGKPFKQFGTLSSWLHGKNKKLTFAMNAGMYHADSSPVGLLVVDGKQISPLNTSDGSGNFFLKPNGVFLISPSGPKIMEAEAYPETSKGNRFATQSGPLLLRNGVINPTFIAASNSRLIRNGVGLSGNIALFVISEQPVTFHEFATFFRDILHCNDALYLDGVVSSLYSVDLRRNDHRADLGPIVGVFIDQTSTPSIEKLSPGKPVAASHAKSQGLPHLSSAANPR